MNRKQNSWLQQKMVRFVVKRDGTRQPMCFDKISARLNKLCYGLHESVDVSVVAQKVIEGLYDGVTTTQLDEVAAENAFHRNTVHPDYGVLGARIAISNLQKNTLKSFSQLATLLQTNKLPKTGKPNPLLADNVYDFIQANASALDAAIVHARDFDLEYLGFKVLCKSTLLKMGDKIVERPQMAWMRVSCGLHCGDLEATLESYHLMSQKKFIPASPTLFHAGTPHPQLASCFLIGMKDDSIEGIYDTLKEVAVISKRSGGCGLNFGGIRSHGSAIQSTNGGKSGGICGFIRVYNKTVQVVDQSGRRKGALTIYLPPHHHDIVKYLDLKKNIGAEDLRARDLFYALWVSDLYMKYVEQDKTWHLFDPSMCPELFNCYGEEFERRYEDIVANKPHLIMDSIAARELFQMILTSQQETGGPFMLFADACNAKSNQKNLGFIQCSNLCTEIIEYSSPQETAVCNLANMALNSFVKNKIFDFQQLFEVTRIVTRNLNKVIDINFYPTEEARLSNMRHRPIGIGIQGFADALILMRLPFESKEAMQWNVDVFETIYYAACFESCELAKKFGPYESFPGSPMSQGVFQFDMWGVTPKSGKWDWEALRKDIMQFGVRNSLLVAPAPTVSTSSILGTTPMFDPIVSNVFLRKGLAGDFPCPNKYLVQDLMELGLWNAETKNDLVRERGSIQNLSYIPDDIKALYKTIWEIPVKHMIDMAADRGPYIDQSQSLSWHMADITFQKLFSAHMYAWKRGLKTGMYYLRSKSAADPIPYTVDQEKSEQKTQEPSLKKRQGDDENAQDTTGNKKQAKQEIPAKKRQRNDDDADVQPLPSKRQICTEEVCTSCM